MCLNLFIDTVDGFVELVILCLIWCTQQGVCCRRHSDIGPMMHRVVHEALSINDSAVQYVMVS